MSSARSIMWGWRCRFSLALQEPEITTYPVPLTSPVIIGDTAGATFCASIQEPGRPDRKHFPKEDFHIELEAGSCTCPAGNVARRIRPLGTRTAATGRTHQLKAFQFDGAVCAGCARCGPKCVAAAPGTGRTVQLHPQEALLQQARALQQSEAFGEYRQRRVVVEHRLARLVHLGIRQSRYFGRVKTKFQLYLAATVANLTLAASKAGRPANTGGGSSAGSALRAGTIRSALEIVPARIGQILTPALLASASLPEYTSPNKGFRPDF